MRTHNRFLDKEIIWDGEGLYYLSPRRELNCWMKVETHYSAIEYWIREGYTVKYVHEADVDEV
jgi:hypothetical protein